MVLAITTEDNVSENLQKLVAYLRTEEGKDEDVQLDEKAENGGATRGAGAEK